jgi:hypothetical protein
MNDLVLNKLVLTGTSEGGVQCYHHKRNYLLQNSALLQKLFRCRPQATPNAVLVFHQISSTFWLCIMARTTI